MDSSSKLFQLISAGIILTIFWVLIVGHADINPIHDGCSIILGSEEVVGQVNEIRTSPLRMCRGKMASSGCSDVFHVSYSFFYDGKSFVSSQTTTSQFKKSDQLTIVFPRSLPSLSSIKGARYSNYDPEGKRIAQYGVLFIVLIPGTLIYLIAIFNSFRRIESKVFSNDPEVNRRRENPQGFQPKFRGMTSEQSELLSNDDEFAKSRSESHRKIVIAFALVPLVVTAIIAYIAMQ